MNAPISSTSKAGHHSSSSSAMSSTRQSASKIVPPPPAEYKTASTDPFLKDYTLLAEAAKRAQVAIMVRDFESCGIS